MKILFLINSLRLGGAEKVFVQQANALKEKGFEVYFGVLEEKKGPLSYFDKLKVDKYFYFGFKNLYDSAVYKRVSRAVKDNKIDIVYSTLPAANLIARTAKIFNPRLKVVIREANVARVKNIKLKIADIVLLPWTHKIIVVSEEVKKSLKRYLFFGRNKIEVINNGIDLPKEISSEDTGVVKKKYNLEKKFVILNVGALNARQKGQIFALRSLNQLVKKHSCQDVKLLLVGEVRIRPEWLKFVKENNLADFVAFLGFLPQEEVYKLYSLADLFILPSLWEGFPNVVLEAQAYQCPVVASNVGGVREIIDNNYNGIVVKVKDVDGLTEAILKVKNNPQLADYFVKNALDRIREKFLFETTLAKLIKVLTD